MLCAVSERPTITVQLTDNFERVLEIARANLAKAKEDNGLDRPTAVAHMNVRAWAADIKTKCMLDLGPPPLGAAPP